ncbi:MAG: ABC transporter ATP-binding protein [Firmicutes bacterium]|nr:ABC transporter ATP-binding protein [Bacillota bacterium]
MNTTQRLVQYAALYRRQIIIALAMLLIAVTADLCGPFIAKTIINQHIFGIEQTWYETQGPAPDAVPYEGHWYRRATYFLPSEPKGRAVSIAQVGAHFDFLPEVIPASPDLVQEGRHVVLVTDSRRVVLKAVALSPTQLFAFYKPEIWPMVQLALLYFGLLVVSSAFTYGEQYLLQVAANRVIMTMRRDVFRQVQRLPIPYFDQLPAGKVVSRITNDTEAIRELYVTVLATVVSSVVNLVGIFIALMILDVRLALICLILIPVIVTWVILYRRYAVRVNEQIRQLIGEINGMLGETIAGMTIIRAFNRQERTASEFDAVSNDLYTAQTRLLRVNSWTGHNLVSVLRNGFFILLLAFVGYRYLGLRAVLSIGALYAFVDYLNRLFQPVGQIVNQLANLEQARASADRVFALLDEPGVDPQPGAIARFEGEVEFTDVSFSYDGQHDVLSGISFVAAKGQTIALVGHTGSGKSSIMNLLLRFYEPRAGRILIDGRDIRTMAAQHLRAHMAIVLQDPYLFTGTLADNISLGEDRISEQRVYDALCAVGGERLLAQCPDGLQEMVREKGSTLSAGQRQLISFARALAFDPAILILDEATASIDTETEALIQHALEVVKSGRTTFIIAHRLSTIRAADVILVLDHGQIVERGSHEQLLASGGRYAQMYRLQQGEPQEQAG